jgi:hypothetical protein
MLSQDEIFIGGKYQNKKTKKVVEVLSYRKWINVELKHSSGRITRQQEIYFRGDYEIMPPEVTCSLDRGTCSNQYGAGPWTGCSSKEPCDNKRPKRHGMKNRGLHQYRFKDNPMEEVYAKAWNLQNTARAGTSEGRGTLDYLLAKDCNYPMGEVTNRDREVAATVIQWLGSPVGQSFVKECQQQKR